MRRVLAVIGAVLIVAAAMAVRSMIEDDDGGSGGDGDGGGDGEVVVVCDTDLRAVCEAIDGVTVRVEDSADTGAALTSGQSGDADAWVTTSAWLEVVQSRAPGALGDAEALASAPVVIASDPTRADAIDDLCAGEALWRCVTDRAEEPWADLEGDPGWGPLRIGLPDADTGLGLSVATSLAIGFFGDADFAANEFPDLSAPLANLRRASGAGDRNLLTTLVRRRGTYSAGGFVAPEVSGRTDVTVLDTEPSVESVVVLVALPDGDAVEADRARRALTDAGWDAAEGAAPPPTLKPGVMAALHSLWTETTG